jgi:hypothetical protein
MNRHAYSGRLVCGTLVLGLIFWFSVSQVFPQCFEDCLATHESKLRDCIRDPSCKHSWNKLLADYERRCEARCKHEDRRRSGTCEFIQDALERLERPMEECAQNQWCKESKGMKRLTELVTDLQGKLKDCSHEPGAEKCKSLRTAIDRLKEVIKDCAQDPSCNRPELVKQLEETMSMFRDKWRRCLKEGSKPKPPAKTGTEGDSGSGSGK